MQFNLDEAIQIANQVVFAKVGRNLTDIEIIILQGAWRRQDYDQIAAQNQYTTSYISQDVAPKLWKLLTEALGEKVKKSNFKEGLKRYWQSHVAIDSSPLQPLNATIARHALTQPVSASGRSNLTIPELEFYIERPPIESLCYETLLQPGALIRIKAPKLMGKTALVSWILLHIGEICQAVKLSFELADRYIHLTNLNKFLRWFCLNITREVGLSNRLDEYWDEDGMGAKVSCTTYFEEYLLTQTDRPLILCLDNVDLLFSHPEVYEDFFSLLRSWYEKAKSHGVWQKLRLVIVHATDVYIRLNINQSPFNVGVPIELPEFTPEQVQSLARQYELEQNLSLVEQLMALVGGHPYLLEQAFSHLKSYINVSLPQFLTEAATEAGVYRNHLRDYWLVLQQDTDLLAAFRQVVSSNCPVRLETTAAYRLQSMGLVKLSGNEVEPRCQLYCRYFGDRLKSDANG